MNTYTIRDIKRINKEKGFYFFSPESMGFFNSQVDDKVFHGSGGIFFTTSEQFDTDSERKYTVRQFHPKTGNVNTNGEFNKLSYKQARTLARKRANGL